MLLNNFRILSMMWYKKEIWKKNISMKLEVIVANCNWNLKI